MGGNPVFGKGSRETEGFCGKSRSGLWNEAGTSRLVAYGSEIFVMEVSGLKWMGRITAAKYYS